MQSVLLPAVFLSVLVVWWISLAVRKGATVLAD
jgi:hypothetical protein